MRKRLIDSASVRTAQEFIIICHHLVQSAREIRPASVWRLEEAAGQIMHFAIHAQTYRRRKGRIWRMQHAIAASEAARRCLGRLAKLDDHRVPACACGEVLDRLQVELRSELQRYEKAN